MAEEWNNNREAQQPDNGQAPTDGQPSQPLVPPTAPYNGWSSDGSYRFVPLRTPENAGSSRPPVAPPPAPRPPQKKHNGWLVSLAILCALAIIAGVVGIGILATDSVDNREETASSSEGVSDENSAERQETSTSKPSGEKVPSLEISDWDDNDGGLTNEEIVNRNFDTSVVISVYSTNSSGGFGESALTEAGGASGIIMSADGYIITNWHCVIDENTGKAYDRIDVTTYDGKTYEDAQVIGSDESTDLAVIKVDAKDLSVARFGDSSTLAVGSRVVAIGNAAGLSWTATFGYVSALARDVYDDTGYAIKCLQVDAAINPGNSGGALLNNQGLVVGINSAKIAATGYEGLGFSIPINEAKVIIDSLLEYGYVKGRVALGIKGQTVTSQMYNGFLISEIDDGSCLEDTDAREGDLIIAVDDVEVLNYGDLRAELAKHKVGDTVSLKLLRANRDGRVTAYTVKVKLQEQKITN